MTWETKRRDGGAGADRGSERAAPPAPGKKPYVSFAVGHVGANKQLNCTLITRRLPFSIPAVRDLDTLELDPKVTFLIGEVRIAA
jgi:hypothetical protein